ncbi:MAG: hypothetical protein AB8F74_08600 [Saprospiraceae bacterium]
MRRPFRKIFAFSLGIMVFFLLAKVFVGAFFLAMFLSIPYLFFRGIKSALRDDRYYPQQYNYNDSDWETEDEPLFYAKNDFRRNRFDKRPAYHFVEVR